MLPRYLYILIFLYHSISVLLLSVRSLNASLPRPRLGSHAKNDPWHTSRCDPTRRNCEFPQAVPHSKRNHIRTPHSKSIHSTNVRNKVHGYRSLVSLRIAEIKHGHHCIHLSRHWFLFSATFPYGGHRCRRRRRCAARIVTRLLEEHLL